MNPMGIGRRRLLKQIAQGLIVAPGLSHIGLAQQQRKPRRTTPPAPKAPARPKLVLNIRDFGAAGDGTSKDTNAIQQALDRCSALGGGEVLIPAGNFLTGAVALKDILHSSMPSTPITPESSGQARSSAIQTWEAAPAPAAHFATLLSSS
jgi:hypothetical protein